MRKYQISIVSFEFYKMKNFGSFSERNTIKVRGFRERTLIVVFPDNYITILFHDATTLHFRGNAFTVIVCKVNTVVLVQSMCAYCQYCISQLYILL